MKTDTPGNRRLLISLKVIIQFLLVVGLGMFLVRRDWENVYLTVFIIALIIVPEFLLKRYRIHIPHDLQLIAVAFVYLSMFLGSANDYYYRYWWWDKVLHVSSGFLLGIIGWIVLFLLNQTKRIPKGVGPIFVSFFAVTFASFVGVVWEIVEYTVDNIAPAVNMQSNETGVADTMNDLILNIVGALIVAVMGWTYIKSRRNPFIMDFVRNFVRKNPRLFRP